MLELRALLVDLTAEEEVERGSDRGDRRELADLFERRRDGSAQEIGGELELEPEHEVAADVEPYGREGPDVAHDERGPREADEADCGTGEDDDRTRGLDEPDEQKDCLPQRDLAEDGIHVAGLQMQVLHHEDGRSPLDSQAMIKPTTPVAVSGLAHIGIRVHDLERSVAFYALLGFTKTAGPIGPEPVAILRHPSGLELNLILNAPRADAPNILMDVPDKHPGITHVALLCPNILAAKAQLEAAGISLSGGPIRFGPGAQGIFVRDPDRNVIELHQRG